jgi:hypothetical protein
MADQNQGASIEAERLIDAVRKLVKAKGRFHTEQNYKALAEALDSYDDARRTPTAAPGAGEMLSSFLNMLEPKQDGYVMSSPCGRTASSRSRAGAGDLPPPGELRSAARLLRQNLKGTPGTATWLDCAQAIACDAAADYFDRIAADRAQRKQAALQEIIDIGQEIEAGAAPNVKTWQERANELAVSGRPRGYPDTDELEALKDAEIAELRAQLAAKGQGFEQWWADQIKASGDAPIGADYRHWAEKGYLAAPASAQPAENPKTVKVLQAALAAALDRDGAQPDQRESAAEGGSKK